MEQKDIPDAKTISDAASKGIIIDWSDSMRYGDTAKVIPIERAKEKRDDQRK